MSNSATFEFKLREATREISAPDILYVKRRTVSQMYRKSAGNPSTDPPEA